MRTRRITKTLTAAGLAVAATMAADQAQAVIITSTGGGNSVKLGVNPEGHLNVNPLSGETGTVNRGGGITGIAFFDAKGDVAGPGYYDATSPACLCEGFGVSATIGGFAKTGHANRDDGAPVNLSAGVVSDVTATTVTTTTSLTSDPGLSIVHKYAEAVVGSLFKADVSITNTTGGTIDDLRYVRVMDWDVPHTEFDEYVTIIGTGTTTFLERSHDDGFETSNPLVSGAPIDAATLNVDFVDNGPRDHGAYFRFNFGSLANGETRDFTVFYGAAPTEREMLASLGSVGAELYSLGQSGTTSTSATIGDPMTFAFGFKGVGGVPVIPDAVPEPITATLGAFGLTALASATRRRRA